MFKIKSSVCLLCLCLVFALSANSQSSDKQAKIKSAISAAPTSVTNNATIMDWPAEAGGEMTVLRKGTNGWTCLPDMPDTPGNDPMCLDEPWMKWADAWMNKTEPQYTKIGIGYMLQGGTPQSNTDPYAEKPTEDNEWMSKSVPHVMIIVPNLEMLDGLPTDHTNGGPWVMWDGTPYAHIMVPMPKYKPGK